MASTTSTPSTPDNQAGLRSDASTGSAHTGRHKHNSPLGRRLDADAVLPPRLELDCRRNRLLITSIWLSNSFEYQHPTIDRSKLPFVEVHERTISAAAPVREPETLIEGSGCRVGLVDSDFHCVGATLPSVFDRGFH